MAETVLRYLLLQVRNADDPMRSQEVGCFARALRCSPAQITVFDLLGGSPEAELLAAADAVLLGGSGDYSVAAGGSWLEPALETMRLLHETSKPTFASCWGCQAMAQALGGEVVTDLQAAEIGSVEVKLTDEGKQDQLFGALQPSFLAQMGHQDRVAKLPPTAIRLAYNSRVANQAFRFPGKPIYCTQFHPELNRAALLQRLVAYPQYVEAISGMPLKDFAEQCEESPETDKLLPLFAERIGAGAETGTWRSQSPETGTY